MSPGDEGEQEHAAPRSVFEVLGRSGLGVRKHLDASGGGGTATKRRRSSTPKGGATPRASGSSFVPCPVCGASYHRALLQTHAAACQGGAAAATPPTATAAAAAAPPFPSCGAERTPLSLGQQQQQQAAAAVAAATGARGDKAFSVPCASAVASPEVPGGDRVQQQQQHVTLPEVPGGGRAQHVTSPEVPGGGRAQHVTSPAVPGGGRAQHVTSPAVPGGGRAQHVTSPAVPGGDRAQQQQHAGGGPPRQQQQQHTSNQLQRQHSDQQLLRLEQQQQQHEQQQPASKRQQQPSLKQQQHSQQQHHGRRHRPVAGSAFDVLMRAQAQLSKVHHFHLRWCPHDGWTWHWWTDNQRAPTTSAAAAAPATAPTTSAAAAAAAPTAAAAPQHSQHPQPPQQQPPGLLPTATPAAPTRLQLQHMEAQAAWSAMSKVATAAAGGGGGGGGGKHTLVLSTNLPPAHGGPIAAAATSTGGGGVGGGSSGGGGACRLRLSAGLAKSALQKAVRRCMPVPAVRLALQLMRDDADSFLRRITVICLEDALLHPALPLLVWLMMASSKGYVMGGTAAGTCLQVVHELAAVGVRDELPSRRGRRVPQEEEKKGEEEVEGGDEEGEQQGGSDGDAGGGRRKKGIHQRVVHEEKEEGKQQQQQQERGRQGGGSTPHWSAADSLGQGALTEAQALLVRCISVRASFGGMACDVAMLKGFAVLWTRRFSGAAGWPPPLPAAPQPMMLPQPTAAAAATTAATSDALPPLETTTATTITAGGAGSAGDAGKIAGGSGSAGASPSGISADGGVSGSGSASPGVGDSGSGNAGPGVGGGDPGAAAGAAWLNFLQGCYRGLAPGGPVPIAAVRPVQLTDVPLASVDFHVSSIMEELEADAHVQSSAASHGLPSSGVRLGFALQTAMWHFRSSVNHKARLASLRRAPEGRDSVPTADGGGTDAGSQGHVQQLEAWWRREVEPLADRWADAHLRKRCF